MIRAKTRESTMVARVRLAASDNMYSNKMIFTTTHPANTKHLYNICAMLDHCQRRWADVVPMLYKCFVFAGRPPPPLDKQGQGSSLDISKRSLTGHWISVVERKINSHTIFTIIQHWLSVGSGSMTFCQRCADVGPISRAIPGWPQWIVSPRPLDASPPPPHTHVFQYPRGILILEYWCMNPEYTRRWPNDGLLLVQRRRLWTNGETTLRTCKRRRTI